MVSVSRDDDALRDFKMISAGESRIRKGVGATVEIALLARLGYAGVGSVPVGLQAVVHSAAIVVFRMGVESQ